MERGHPLVFGHRGMPGDKMENRMEAFLEALRVGADGVELDVQLSADGIPMVIHDARVERTTRSTGRVDEMSCQALQRLGVPRLETVLERIPASAILAIEIKDFSLRDRGLERAVTALVKAQKAEERVIFSSFNPLALARLYQLDRLFYAAQLTGPGLLKVFRLGYIRRPLGVHPHYREVTLKRLRAWRRAGQRVILWGANTQEDLATVLSWDVDGIITDLPAEAAVIRSELYARKTRPGQP